MLETEEVAYKSLRVIIGGKDWEEVDDVLDQDNKVECFSLERISEEEPLFNYQLDGEDLRN